MEGRTVLQWDKDDCAAAGLVKFDLLGLGMLEALHRTVDLVRDHHGVPLDLGALPQEDAVYDLLCRADTVGVFQVESRAQMGTLPRVQPRCFYDLAVEVALIRPGPIQGNAVHPYIRRRRGTEPVTYPHPLLQPALERTLGVPVFQEQLMQIVIDVAGFSPAEADELRQAMSHKRSDERMARLRDRLFAGMAARGVGRGRGRGDLHEPGRLRQLRLPRVPRPVLRLPRLLVGLAEAALPGGLHRRPAERPADGVLVAAEPAGRRQTARDGGPAPRRQRQRGGGLPGGRPGRPGPAAGAGRRPSASGDDGGPPGRWRGPGPAPRTWSAGAASPAPSSRRWPWPARSMASRPTAPRRAAGPWCGRPGRRPRPSPAGCPGWSRERWPRRCRPRPPSRRSPTTCGRSG